MKSTKILTAAALAAALFSASVQAQTIDQNAADEFCKANALLGHDAFLLRLHGVKQADAKKIMLNKFQVAAQNDAAAQKQLRSDVDNIVNAAYKTNLPKDMTAASDQDKEKIAIGVGTSIYNRCMDKNTK